MRTKPNLNPIPISNYISHSLFCQLPFFIFPFPVLIITVPAMTAIKVKQKVNSRCFKLLRSYSISFNLTNNGEFFLVLNSEGLYLNSEKEKIK